MITDFIIGMFIAAARNAAVWPQPFRRDAWAALSSVPLQYFEPWIEQRFN